MAKSLGYTVVISPATQRDLRRLSKAITPAQLIRIDTKIRDLADDPRPVGAEKLSGEDYYRIRDGDYRILYRINDDRSIVEIARVRSRADAYRKR